MSNSQNGVQNRSQSDNSLHSASGTRAPPVSSSDDKSNQAARMAQQLASQSSWADTYVPATPTATTATPAESTVDDGESERLMRNEDMIEPPPSYEESRRAHAESSTSQPRQDNVRQEPSIPQAEIAQDPPQDPENGDTVPLLIHNSPKIIKRRKERQKRFLLCFALFAFLLMAIQAIKGMSGFRNSDGTPIPPIPNRNYTQHETSQSIGGTFSFYDSLDLSTASGSINIIIDPQASDVTGVIRVASKSGSIKVRFAEEYMKKMASSGQLDRTYDILIQSVSGSQNVDLPQGNGGTTRMASTAGSLTGTFTGFHLERSDNVSTLHTESEHGSQKITVKSASSKFISKLKAIHYNKGSASLKVAYPSVWEGMVHASVGGYSTVSVVGNNLQYQRNGNRDVYAWRMFGDAGKEPQQEGQVVEVRCDGSGSVKVDCSAS